MLDERGLYPRLALGVSLVHPEKTDVFFLYCSAGGRRYELNEVSFEMVRRMDGQTTTDDICGAICAQYDDAHGVNEDLDTLLRQLADEGLVQFVSL